MDAKNAPWPAGPTASLSGSRFFPTRVQTVISSGIPSLDSVLSGGFPLGTLSLIEEDKFGIYALTLLKYFLMEGCVHRHDMFAASAEISTEELVRQIPRTISTAALDVNAPQGDLKIAWRYKDVPQVVSSPGIDAKTSIDEEDISKASIRHWKPSSADVFSDLVSSLYKLIEEKGLFADEKSVRPKGTLLRVIVHGLGSAFWKQPQSELPSLFYRLRVLAHHSHTAIVVTVPKYLIIEPSYLRRCQHLSDYVIELESLNEDTNPLFSEFNGLVNFVKFPVINSLAASVPLVTDWAFKVRRKKFIIEKLHLPPELATSEQREQDEAFSCSGPRSVAMQF